VRLESSIKAGSPPPSLFAVCYLQHSQLLFNDLFPAAMGRKALSIQDHIDLAKKRGYFVQCSPDEQKVKNQVEQRSLSDATKNKHEEVANIFQE
jgi:hypothetical protein